MKHPYKKMDCGHYKKNQFIYMEGCAKCTLNYYKNRRKMGEKAKNKEDRGCPKCGYDQHCPCNSPRCKRDLPKGHKPWIWLKNDLIKCANCGYTNHTDWWLEYSWNQNEKLINTNRKEQLGQ